MSELLYLLVHDERRLLGKRTLVSVKIFSTFTCVSAVFYCLKIETENTIYFTSSVKNKNQCLKMLFKICLGGSKLSFEKQIPLKFYSRLQPLVNLFLVLDRNNL